MLTVVYVLVSGEKDYFYEQFLMSVTSLRYRMKEVNVLLLVEQSTNDYLLSQHEDVHTVVDEIVVCKLPEEYSMKARSRILKTRMRELIEGDFLYIDCDTVICDTLEDIQKMPVTGAVLDNHRRVSEDVSEFAPVIERAKKNQFSVGYENQHFNSGVIWCKDDEITREFFKRWNECWYETYKKNIMIDQLSLNEVNHQMKGMLTEISGVWNCQLRFGLPYLADAKIIHYFASNINTKTLKHRFAYKLTNNDIWREIRESGHIPDEVCQMLYSPKQAFESAVIVEIKTPNYYIINSNIASALRALYRKSPKVFWGIDRMLGKIKKED